MLLKYNLIIVNEKLQDKDYRRQIEKMFGLRGLARKKVYPTCARESAVANEKNPLLISNDTMKRIEDCNTPDSVLYRQMTTCPDGFHFPKFNKSLFI